MGAGLRSATRERYPLHFPDRGSCMLLLGPCLAEGFQTNCKIKEAALPLRVPRHDVGNCDSPVILLMTINRDRRARVLSSGAALLCLIAGPRCSGIITGSLLFLSSSPLSPFSPNVAERPCTHTPTRNTSKEQRVIHCSRSSFTPQQSVSFLSSGKTLPPTVTAEGPQDSNLSKWECVLLSPSCYESQTVCFEDRS